MSDYTVPAAAEINSVLASDAIADKIVSYLFSVQQRELQRDTGHGYCTTKQIAQHTGQSPAECRTLLRDMATEGHIQCFDCANGVFWRSVNPLPWEEGGSLQRERARLDALWAQPHVLIVQAVYCDRDGNKSRDVKSYPEGLHDLAEAQVERENRTSEARLRDDYANDRHLRACYDPPPSYRLVTLHVARDRRISLTTTPTG